MLQFASGRGARRRVGKDGMRHDQKLAFLDRLDARGFAGGEMQRVVSAVAVLGDGAFAGEHEDSRRAGQRKRAAGAELVCRAGERAAAEIPQALGAHAGGAGELEPLERVRIDEQRLLEALLRIFDAPAVGVFPYRLEAVLRGAGHVIVRVELALLEAPAPGERFDRLLALVLRDIAAAARAADLHGELDRVLGRGLRAVGGAFGEVADAARVHRAVLVEAEATLELHAHLVEVVHVARREEVTLGPDKAQIVIAERTWCALPEVLVAEAALPVIGAARVQR